MRLLHSIIVTEYLPFKYLLCPLIIASAIAYLGLNNKVVTKAFKVPLQLKDWLFLDPGQACKPLSPGMEALIDLQGCG